ncbi:alginate lyase family protein [Fretibacter rubidus]|uniref:alginate lyase family protein n=1 Tax=Fretibacter rubidus TaxID=570162 RepID=UPI00352A289F
MRKLSSLIIAGGVSLTVAGCQPSQSPTAQGSVGSKKANVAASSYQGPTFEDDLNAAKVQLEAQMKLPITVPVPKDPGGGYTHEKHKQYATLIYNAGQIYKLTGEKQYADYAGKLMLAYAKVYPSWALHPAKKEQSPGRMFWQNLNESMWLLNAAQSYAAIKDTLTQEQRDLIETDLLRNMSDFLSDGSPETFNKVHNHGTWATAAVGLTGYAIGDDEYVQQALLGLDKSGDAGFLKQMDKLFSPDGYYNEGPYYQRFALMPFVIFAQEVQKNNPELKIFEKRDGILRKAIYTTIQQNYGGLFFPINDAIKEKGIKTRELVHGVAIAYDLTGDKGLLSIGKAQGRFMLTPESRKLSQDIVAGKGEPFNYRTMRLGDGEDGTEGALDIIRASEDPDDLVIVAKNTSQGLGHGHFDKMGILVYDAGYEILRDYAAARFLNVEAKYGGHYLPENNKFAKQTIAHNALVVDETSHFGGSTVLGNQHSPELGTFYVSDGLKITSAEISTAYDDVRMVRNVAMIDDPAFTRPVIIDVMTGHADTPHQYDLPFYYNGHIVDTNLDIEADTLIRKPLGTANGYQYLWKVGEADAGETSQITWLLDRSFYSVTTAVPENTKVLFAEIGANDPDFNLRNEPAFILRATTTNGARFVSVIEPHGDYNPTVEYTIGSHSQVADVKHFAGDSADYVRIETKTGAIVGLGIAKSMTEDQAHSVSVDGQDMVWTGPYKVFHSNGEP